MTGKQWEDIIQAALEANDIEFTRENSTRSYGVARGNKGKFDFETKNAAIECKTIGRASNLRMPIPGTKNTVIKSHQLRSLRIAHEQGKKAGLMIYIQSDDLTFWLPIMQLHLLVAENYPVKHLSIQQLRTYGTTVYDLNDFVDKELR